MAILPHYDERDPEESQRTLVVPTDWITQQCSVPGCTVMIRSRIGQQGATLPVCKWCQAGTAYYRKAVSPPAEHGGAPMSLDEFGRDLYDAIVLRASSVMASNGAKRMREQGYHDEAARAEDSAKTADEALHRILDKGTINENDLRRLLKIQ